MPLCIGTALGIIVPTTIGCYLTHRAAGMVMARVLRAGTLPATAGVAVAAGCCLCARRGLQARVRGVRGGDRRQAAVRAGRVGGRARAAGSRADGCLRLCRRPCCRSHGHQRPLATILLTSYGQSIQSGSPPRPGSACRLRSWAPLATSLRGWPHRAQLPALYRVRFPRWGGHHGADLELCGALRRAAGARPCQAHARDRLRTVSARCCAALALEPSRPRLG